MFLAATSLFLMVAAIGFFAWARRMLSPVAASHAKVATTYQPIFAEESRLKERSDQYATLQGLYSEWIGKLRENEHQLAKYNIGVGTMDTVAYQPIGKGEHLEALEGRLTHAKQHAVALVKNKTACICGMGDNVVVNNRKAAAKKLFNREIKLRIRCLDNDFRAAAALADWNNIGRLVERVRDTFNAINSSGHTVKTYLQPAYLEAKIEELRLQYEARRLAQALKEEQREERRIEREAEREEARIKAAAKKAQKDRIEMERLIEEELRQIESASEEQMRLLELHKRELEILRHREERAISLAQTTRAGYVYVISNTLSFGEGICKIGMTRRADPNDRVKELGDASVPELFDIHAFVFTQDAPALEKYLHRQFSAERVNLVNPRKEFFAVTPQIVIDAIEQYSGSFERISTD